MFASIHIATWLTALASMVAVAETFFHPGFTGMVLVALSLAHWAARCRRRLLTRLMATVVIIALLPGLFSYIIPESWFSIAQWQAFSQQIWADSCLENWRAPLLATLATLLLALSLLLDGKVQLGTLFLLSAIALLLATQGVEHLFPLENPPLLDYSATWPQMAVLGFLLGAQSHLFYPQWRHQPGDWHALLPSTLLLIMVLLLWQHQHRDGEQQLYTKSVSEGQQLTSRLNQEIDAHRQAMQRFSRFWSLLDTPPTATQWAQQAAYYHADFRYFLNIAFINTQSRITHVFPATPVNLSIIGQRLYEAQPSGRAALEPALEGQRPGNTQIIELLQGGPGVVTYWPLRQSDNRLVGAAAMAISIPMLANALFSHLDPDHGQLRWHEDDRVLASFGTTTSPGPWQHHYPLKLSESPLTLSIQPRRDYLLAQLPRLPSIGLGVGLVLAYLLYLVMHAFQQLSQHNRAMQDNNATLQSEIEKRGRLQREVEWLALHDELTGIANRRHFLEQAARYQDQRPLSLILCDIDNFKRINDQLGHLVGDDYLIATARIGAETCGEHNLFARYGGEEFIALLPGVEHEQATALAEQLRTRLQAAALRHLEGQPLTLSAGVVTCESGEMDLPRLMQQVDEALYRAKEKGRNRVESVRYPT